MSLFQSILSQLEEKISKKSNINEKAALVISTVLHTTVNADQIMIQDSTLRIKAAPTIKMAIMLNCEKIIKALQEVGIDITTIQ